jgi:hypothetical protein
MIWLPEAKPPPTWVPNQTDATVKAAPQEYLAPQEAVVAHACFPPILFPHLRFGSYPDSKHASLKTL